MSRTSAWLYLIFCFLGASSAVNAAPVRLVVWGITPTAESKDTDAEIAAFERMYPNVQVITLSMGGAMNPQKLMTSIVGGVPPDVINQDRFTIGDWASRGAFMPLDGFLDTDARSSDPTAVRQKNYIAAAWSEASFRGHVYAIPDGMNDRVLFYNKQSFRDAGLDPNRPPRTWDEMMADAKRLTRPAPGGGYSKLGFVPTYVQGGLYIWSWQLDGDPMSADGRICTLNNPRTTAALTAMVSWFDQLGGVDALSGFAGSFGSEGGAMDPFLSGSLAMKTDDNDFVNAIARYTPDLDFGVVPIPVPSDRFHHLGRFKDEPTYVTWAGGFSLVIPRGARHAKEAWEFIRWMTSPQASLIGAKAQAAYQRGKGLPYVPDLYPNVVTNKLLDSVYLPLLTPRMRQAEQVSLDLLPNTKFRPVTFVGLLLADQANRATDAAIRHLKTPKAALDDAQRQVQIQLDAVYHAGHNPLLPVRSVAVAFALIVLGVAAGLTLGVQRWMARQKRAERAEARSGMLFILPWVLGFLVFTLGPILASLILSFCDYDVLHPARWVGMSNYVSLATTDRPMVVKSLSNALYLGVVGIPLGLMTSLAMALLLNSKTRGLHWYRTAFYIPSIVPVVASSVLWAWILNSDPHRGLINGAWLATISSWFHVAPPGWLAVPDWSKPGMIIMGLWGAGGGMILWLAGLQSIPATLYEAASLDGAGSWSRFKNITLPMLSPYIFFNLIMGIIGTLQTFESAYILGGTGNGGSTGPDDSLLVPVVYLFNNAFQYFRMGYASAIAWLLFVLILGLTLGQLKLAPRWVHYEEEAK